MEEKRYSVTAEEHRYPITAEEHKLKATVRELVVLVGKVVEPYRTQSWGPTLDNLFMAQSKLNSACRWLSQDDISPENRRYVVGAIVYHYDFKHDPFRIIKLSGDSIWTRLKKSMPAEHYTKIDRVFELLKAYVAPVASKFQ